MRFTSLIVELIRARPVLVFWLVVLAQAALWFLLPALIYSSPPGDVALNLAYGREYLLGSVLGPPLAFWLADIAFRAAGNNMFGVYLLSQACFVVSFWAIFRLGRAIVGAQHAVLAVLLTITVTAFAFPSVEYGPHTLAQPMWALTLLTGWRVIGEGKRNAWFALSIYAGLLLLTTQAAPLLLLMLGIFALATAQGRRMLISFDTLFALIVIVVLVLPYAVFATRAGIGWEPALPNSLSLEDGLWRWLDILGALALALAGVVLLVIVNSRRLSEEPERAPVIFRPTVDPLARNFVYCFALLPPAVFSILGALLNAPSLIAGTGTVLLMSGLCVVVAAGDLVYLRRQRFLRLVWAWIIAAPALFVLAITLAQPWILGTEVRTMLPARDIGAFFADSFQRRTGQPLAAVAGDPQLATVIGYSAPGRPHLLLDAAPDKTPWTSFEKFNETGGVIVWRAADTAGTPPDEIARRFPGLVPEVPRSFQRYLTGRQPLLRVGWAIVRPAAAGPSR